MVIENLVDKKDFILCTTKTALATASFGGPSTTHFALSCSAHLLSKNVKTGFKGEHMRGHPTIYSNLRGPKTSECGKSDVGSIQTNIHK